VLASVESYARGITIDMSRLETIVGGLDVSNPEAISQALSQGMFAPQESAEQRAALARLETVLALIEGWVDEVTAAAAQDRLAASGALRETLRRRRAAGGPAEQTFGNLVGLELRPRRLREATELWRLLGETRGTEGRDATWAHPDLLPDTADLENPAAFAAGASELDFDRLLDDPDSPPDVGDK
jgi:putative hydrolase